MNRLRELTIRDNKDSRDSGDAFRLHREKITELLRSGPTPRSAGLCVLGAGNCNDLDLRALLDTYREIHLVDLDGDAVAWGVAQQGAAGLLSVNCHGGIDVTGVLDMLTHWSPLATLPDKDLATCEGAPVQQVGPALPGPFEVVASTCLLSQLIRLVVHTAGEGHPRFLEAVRAVRAGHLRLLAHLVSPGGQGVLITDIVSTESFPALGSVPEVSLPTVLARLVQEGNFFHGLNPAVLASFFRTDPVVAPQVAALEQVRPWLWDFGPRVYGVCALKFRKVQDT
jgi:hypothetical protein